MSSGLLQVFVEPEEGRRTYRPKRCGNNNKDEDNSPKNLNDKNQQASSQKFRQLIYIYTWSQGSDHIWNSISSHQRFLIDGMYLISKLLGSCDHVPFFFQCKPRS